MLKLNTSKFLVVLFALLAVCDCLTTEEAVQKGVLQIQPTALESLRNYFDVVVVLVKEGKKTDKAEEDYLAMIDMLNKTVPTTLSRLYGIIDLEDDVQEALKKYEFAKGTSIQLITKKKNYEYLGSTEDFIEFYKEKVQPKLKVYESFEDVPANTLIMVVNETEADLVRSQELSNQIIEGVREFDVQIASIRSNTSQIYIKLPNKAIKYSNDLDDIPSILEFVSVQTLPLVFQVSDENYHRVFGSPIDKQVLLVYNQSLNQSVVQHLRSALYSVATHNRQQELRYQRLIFAAISMRQAVDLFGDLLEDMSGVDWKLLITKTDYKAFQVERYLYTDEELTHEKLQGFVEDFRMKRLEPYYRSEKRPDPQQEGTVWKVVGKTFEEFVYGDKEKSAMILFVDGKEPASFVEWEKEFRGFSEKYKDFLTKDVRLGIFDLALNEHKLLHLDFAPQIVLFEKTNKKRARSFRGQLNEDNLRDWINYWVKTLNIPDDFGKKPLELGL